MRKIVVLGIFSLLFLLPVVLVAACQQQPESAPPPPAPAPTPALAPTPAPAPAPTPAPTPSPLPPATDEPKLSEEEICALIWNRIPSKLPDGYSKNDLSKDTRTANYEGDGKWQFSVFGKVRQEGPIVTETVKTEDYWVDRESCNVTSYELHLTAMYYENTKILDISVEKQNEQVTTETSDTPILRKEIKLKWLNVWGTAHKGEAEGCIENIGKIPIDGLLIEITLFDEDWNVIVVEKCKITPDPIPAGELGKFKQDLSTTGKHFHSYDFRFILETGQTFEYLEGSGEEEPVFFYEMDIEEAMSATPQKPPVPADALIYEDDFSYPRSGWLQASYENYECYYENNEYHIIVKSWDWAAYIWNCNAGQLNDFTLEIDARIVSGPPSTAYGVIFRRENDNNFYRFLVTGHGYYQIGTRTNGVWTTLQRSTRSPLIEGGNRTNNLKVNCQGSSMDFYVNSKYLTTIEDHSFVKGCVGMIVDTREPDVNVAFDNIKIYSILTQQESLATYNNTEYGFSVKYPEEWTFSEDSTGIMVAFLSPFIPEAAGMISIYIGAMELPEFPKITLEEHVDMTEMQLKSTWENFEKIQEYKTAVDGLNATAMSYTFDMTGVEMMATEVDFIKENVVYAITYVATEQTHDDYFKCLELIMNSFKFQ